MAGWLHNRLAVRLLTIPPVSWIAPTVSRQAYLRRHWCPIEHNRCGVAPDTTGSTIVVVRFKPTAIILASVGRIAVAIIETRLTHNATDRWLAGCPGLVADGNSVGVVVDLTTVMAFAAVVGIVPEVNTSTRARL